MRVETPHPGVTVESVDRLYRQFDSYDIPEVLEGMGNPLAGRVTVIPRKASHYVMVQVHDTERVAMARLVMKGLAKRRKVREAVCEKHEVNFNQFSPAGKVLVLYV